MMDLYRCDFVDHGNNIRSSERFRAPDDEAAIRHAKELNVASIGAGFVLWQEDRQVYRHVNAKM
jgi:hypothetical protein